MLQLLITNRQRQRAISDTRKGVLERLRMQRHLPAPWYSSVLHGEGEPAFGQDSLLGPKQSPQQKPGIGRNAKPTVRHTPSLK